MQQMDELCVDSGVTSKYERSQYKINGSDEVILSFKDEYEVFLQRIQQAMLDGGNGRKLVIEIRPIMKV